MEVRKFIFYFFIFLGFVSCEKKSERIVARNEHQQTQIAPKSLKKSISNSSNQSSKSSTTRAFMSGSEIFEKYNSAVFMIFTSDGQNYFQGSGFFISTNGIAVSNYHVFQGTNIGDEKFKLPNGNVYKLKGILAKSEEYDFILFEVEGYGESFNYIPISKTSPRVGEKVFAIGSPRGLENTFSSGEISQLRGDNIIQINVPIDHGSSGGALINSYGEVVGITTSGYDDSGANLNFAIDINVINNYLQQ